MSHAKASTSLSPPACESSRTPYCMFPHRWASASAARIDGPVMSVPPRAYWYTATSASVGRVKSRWIWSITATRSRGKRFATSIAACVSAIARDCSTLAIAPVGAATTLKGTAVLLLHCGNCAHAFSLRLTTRASI
jgi:hypothetical protein